ncbi:hypothetical protein PR048_011226 [Dryococelus australis]|uniref:Uncharacterized protein n=1 Tax=Dryococelus australis TaxID=614101 RepID=A0ABQ9HKY6_9NEOP|nr:hypothetical protein PR048_011226 [Dryococelus australis]
MVVEARGSVTFIAPLCLCVRRGESLQFLVKPKSSCSEPPSTTVVEETVNSQRSSDKMHSTEEMQGKLRLSESEGCTTVSHLNTQVKEQQEKACKTMIAVISSLKYLACSGNEIHGHYAFGGNLQLLLHEREFTVPELKLWLLCRDNWLSPVA